MSGHREALERAKDMARAAIPQGRVGLAESRKLYEDFCARFEVPGEATTEEVVAGGVPALMVLPPGEATHTIVYLHGGGYVVGSAYGYRALGHAIATETGARVLLVDYRRAPEAPHPAAIEDAVAAVRWATAQYGPVVLGGDSAGGGLAISTLVALRDAGDALPTAAFVLSPWVDLTLAASAETLVAAKERDPIVSAEGLTGLAGVYLQGTDATTPSASPLFADLAGLPPVLILAGGAEAILGDSQALDGALREAGVDSTLHVEPDMVHVYPMFASFLPEAADAVRRIGAFAGR